MNKRQHTGLTSVACNAAEAARTIELKTANGMDRATSVGVGFTFTNGAAGATVGTFVVYKSADDGANYHQVPAWTYAGSGIYDAESYSQRVTWAAAGTAWLDIDMKNANAVKVIFSTDTADADDEMSAYVMSDYNKG